MFCRIILFLLIAFAFSFSQLSFVTPPSLVRNGGAWTITFAVSQYTDVEVAVVRMTDSAIVRHIGAGKLGANPPPPFAANSLSQTLQWDGKDDLGVPLADTVSLSVRVRAGMSVSLLGMTVPDPYQIGSQMGGVATDDQGNAFVFSAVGTLRTTTIRKYDASGNYLKTLYPFPGNLSAAEVRGYGISDWSSGAYYSPWTQGSAQLEITGTLVGACDSWLMDHLVGNQLALFNKSFLMQKIQPSGAMVDQKTLVPSSSLPASRGGQVYLCPAPGKNYLFLSGVYQYQRYTDWVGGSADTGFWKDGQVFKINLQTGQVTHWLALDSVPTDTAGRIPMLGNLYLGVLSAIHGVATDDSGHIFICDRFHQRVGVYDTNAVFLGSVPVRDPDLVAVNRYTGALYVITRSLDHSGYPKANVSLYKFSGWRPGFARVDSMMNFMTNVGEAFGAYNRSKAFLSLAQSQTRPVIWCGGGNNVWTIADNGSSLSLQFDFASRKQPWVPGYDRMAVDRNNETVYFTDGWSNLYKIDDWNNPAPRPCSTSTGNRLYAGDLSISPDNLLYIREGTSFSGPITRYTMGRRHTPVPFANSNTNVLTSYIYGRYGAGYGDKGLAVAPDGRVAVAYMGGWNDFFVGLFGDSTGHSGDTAAGIFGGDSNRILTGMTDRTFACSPRYDLKGNLYAGMNHFLPPGYVEPAGFAGDPYFYVGSVVKLPANTFGCKLLAGGQFSCANVKIYSTPISPFQAPGGCVCRSPRFDVDAYGRLFLPHGLYNNVTVVDNEGSPLVEFGHYGNVDSYGPGSPVPEVDIPLAFPLAVAASDNYIYVNDMVNNRMVRMQMDYVLDNIPGIKKLADEKTRPIRELKLAHCPNPFNPASKITLNLPERTAVRLDVYDVKGCFVRNLAAREMGAGAHLLVWDATDRNNRPVSAGVYVYRLTAGNRILINKTVLSK